MRRRPTRSASGASASAPPTAPIPCAVTSTAVASCVLTPVWSIAPAIAGTERDERRGEQGHERDQPDRRATARLGHRHPRAVDDAAERTRAESVTGDGGGQPEQHQGHDHRGERGGVDPEDHRVVVREEREPGQRGPDDPAEVELGGRERDGAEQVLLRDQVGHHRLVRGESDRGRGAPEEGEEHRARRADRGRPRRARRAPWRRASRQGW